MVDKPKRKSSISVIKTSLISCKKLGKAEERTKKNMGSLQKLAALLIAISVMCTSVRSVPNTKITNYICNNDMYADSDYNFQMSLDNVLSRLEIVTPNTNGQDYYTSYPSPNPLVYGHASCVQGLSTSDCISCLGIAKSLLKGNCPKRTGVQLSVVDCSIRYEEYPFNK